MIGVDTNLPLEMKVARTSVWTRRVRLALGILAMGAGTLGGPGLAGEGAKMRRGVIAFMGDTMLGRMVSLEIPRRRPEHFWGTTLPILKRCDLRLLNLETTITTADTPWREWKKKFYYRAVPEAVNVLKAAGIDYVNLANNHILDYSEAGLRETLSHLDRAGIRRTGAGFSFAEAARPVTLAAGGVTVGVFSFADHYPEWDASRREGGIFLVSIPPGEEDLRRIREIVGKLRDGHDLVVVSAHWGPNMQEFPAAKVRDFARRLVEEGVDVVHGHSAHVFHGVEVHRGGVILYDTGDFLDDYAVDPDLRNDYSFLYLLTVEGGRIRRLELVPVVIGRMQVNVAGSADARRIQALFEQRTRPFGTRYQVEGDRIVVSLDPPSAAGAR